MTITTGQDGGWQPRRAAFPPSLTAVTAVAWLLCLASVVLYFWDLDVPYPEPSHDTESIALNALCLDRFGHDEYGSGYPLVSYRSVDDYKAPLYLYLAMALFKVTGPSLLAMKAMSAAFGLLGLAAAFAACRPLLSRPAFAVLAPVFFPLFLLSSWVIVPHRHPTETCLSVFFAALFLIAARAFYDRPDSLARALCLGLVAGIMAYAYHALKFMCLTGSAGFAVLYLTRLRPARGRLVPLLAFAGTALLILAPFAVEALTGMRSQARAAGLMVFDAGHFLSQFAIHVSPLTLFVKGVEGESFQAGNAGLLNAALAPFFLCGLYALCRGALSGGDGFSIFILWLYASAGIIPGLVTPASFHGNTYRILIALPAVIAICMAGAGAMYEVLCNDARKLAFVLLCVVILGGYENYKTLSRVLVLEGARAMADTAPRQRIPEAWREPKRLTGCDDHAIATVRYRLYRVSEQGDACYCGGQ